MHTRIMIVRRCGLPFRLGPVAALAAGLALAACGSGAPTSTPPPPPAVGPQSLTDLTDDDWADVIDDVDCSVNNMGVEVLGVRFADVRGGGVRDAFVWVDCVHNASTWPHQLEVFDGSSPPASPRRIAVLQSTQDNLLIRSVTFSGHTVQVDSAGYAETDPMCCPSRTVQRTFTWTGERFEQGGS